MKNRTLQLVGELLRPNTSKRRSIPVFDGAMSPNDDLDDFEIVENAITEPEDLAMLKGEELLIAGKSGIHILAGSKKEILVTPSNEVISIAVGPNNQIFAGIADVGVVQIGFDGSQEVVLDFAGGQPLRVPSSMTITPEGQLFVTDASTVHRWDQRPRDLMTKGASGRLIQFDLNSGMSTEIISDLAWPSGICVASSDHLVLAESWAHQISMVDISSRSRTVLKSGLAAYPARVNLASGGRFWLTFWAARNRFVEFVLTEDEFRKEMIETIPQEFWLGPAIRSTNEPWEPMQIGGMRHHNKVKPWSPPRSYGLCARFNKNGRFDTSFHARAGSIRHGTTAGIEKDGVLYVVSRGVSLIMSKEVAS